MMTMIFLLGACEYGRDLNHSFVANQRERRERIEAERRKIDRLLIAIEERENYSERLPLARVI